MANDPELAATTVFIACVDHWSHPVDPDPGVKIAVLGPLLKRKPVEAPDPSEKTELKMPVTWSEFCVTELTANPPLGVTTLALSF